MVRSLKLKSLNDGSPRNMPRINGMQREEEFQERQGGAREEVATVTEESVRAGDERTFPVGK
jgi:hypothetical protein